MEQTHQHIEAFVADGEIEQAISALGQLSVPHNEYPSYLTQLAGRYSQMAKADIMGVLSSEEKSVAINKISASILTLLKVVKNYEKTGAFSPADFLSNIAEIKLPDLQLGNVDARNLHFTGREQELALLNTTLHSGQAGILTAVHGIGGMGKTALAIEYAYAFGHEYGAGVWVVRCEGKMDLRAGIAELASTMGISLSEAEKREPNLQFDRVMAELRQLAETHTPKRCLLLLDNVDQPKLLEPAQTKFISSKSWLHIIATTRLGESELYGKQKDRAFVAVDELPEQEALSLIESYQPEEQFQSEAEREAAQEIVQLLEGFTLAVEVTAVFLGEFAEDIDCQSFLLRLKAEGLEGIEGAAQQSRVGIRHGEKLLSATLAPTLEKLSGAEKLALNFAALLPPDLIPISWIHAQLIEQFPEFAEAEKPGYPNPWKGLLRRLFNLRLLQVVEVSKDNEVLLGRIHRLVGEIIQKKLESKSEKYLDLLIQQAFLRSDYLNRNWHNPSDRWEIEPLVRFTLNLLDEAHTASIQLVKQLGQWLWDIYIPLQKVEALHHQAIGLLKKEEELKMVPILSNLGSGFWQMGRVREARALLIQVIEIEERLRGPSHHFLAIRYNNLALVEQDLGHLGEAKKLNLKAIGIREQLLPSNHPALATSYNNLAGVELSLGNLNEAKNLLQKALKIYEGKLPANHPDLAESYNNLAAVQESLGNFDEAKMLHQKALEILEKVLPSNHPHLATSYNNLAGVELALYNLEEAKRLNQKARKIWEIVLPPNHPDLATSYNNLASVEHSLGNLDDAKKFYQKALVLREKILPATHSDLASSYNNLASVEYTLRNLTEAKNLFQKALGIWENALPSNHPNLITVYKNLAIVEEALGNHKEAASLRQKAHQASQNPNNP